MPSPCPKYDEGVPKDCCKVRSCNAEGQEFPGQIAAFPYGHPTSKSQGVVKRKPVFGYDQDYTYSLLEPVFSGIGGNCDYERLSEKTLTHFVDMLDEVDLQAIQYEESEVYVNQMLAVCNSITEECTGMGFLEMGIEAEVMIELSKAWRHFVRLVWVRDLEWENLVRCISDPNGDWSVDEEYYTKDPSQLVRYVVSSKLLVPLQVWSVLLREGWQRAGMERQGQHV